ncbi:MAG: vanadium-dependent haloperoxidase [Vicinamibacteraceae bacterium]
MQLRQTARRVFVSTGLVAVLGTSGQAAGQVVDGFRGAWGPRFDTTRSTTAGLVIEPPAGLDPVRRWNAIAVNASGLDHTPVAPGENRVYGEQLGPGRASCAMAIVHIAMFDAVNAIVGRYASYATIPPAPPETSLAAAVAQAAHDTLTVLFPSQAASFAELLGDDLRVVTDERAKAAGVDVGQRAAAAILARRARDGSDHEEPRIGVDWIPSDAPGRWRQDPISRGPLALGAHWGAVAPFALRSGSQFRVPPPPALNSAAYAQAFDEVKRLGGDGIVTPTERTDEQTDIGIYWAYDGTPSLCAPPRLYNQIAVRIATDRGTSMIDLARLLALVNVALAEAGVAIWESKYYYDFWRPVTAIREANPGTGPTGEGDGNLATFGDPSFSPLGAPASNLSGPSFTPPFPSYPSGHAGLGGALFQTLRRFYGTDAIPFTFVSDEFNGVTQGGDGTVRPLRPRSFSSLSDAEAENGQSRIYLGIHWSFDITEGIAQGRQVGDWVFDRLFVPLSQDRDRDGLPDVWELRTGLDPGQANADEDPDADGLTNAQEYAGGTHPRGFYKCYFAEGAIGRFFSTELALVNPDATQEAHLLVSLLGERGERVHVFRPLAPMSRAVLDAASVLGPRDSLFSVVVESDIPMGADRKMSWDRRGYGSSGDSGVPAPGRTWHFAEGATDPFELFYLLENPGTTEVDATITYLLTTGAPVVKTHRLPPRSRRTVYVNQSPELRGQALSATITADQPIVVERAMYLHSGGDVFGAGHAGSGAATLAQEWFFAEGATTFFDTFLLLANPGDLPGVAKVRYQLPDGGTMTKSYALAPTSRVTVWVDGEDQALASTAVAMTVTSTVPIVAERAMWWPGEPSREPWYEGHVVIGATTTGTKWTAPGGSSGGPYGETTYVLIANQASQPGAARVTAVFDDGTIAERQVELPPTSRTTLEIGELFGMADRESATAYSVIVESVGASPVPLVVECSRYDSRAGAPLGAGGVELAVRLP